MHVQAGLRALQKALQRKDHHLRPWRNPDREPPAKAGARVEGFDGAADCVKTYGTSFDKLRTSG